MFNRYAQPERTSAADSALPDVGLYVDDDRSIAAVSHPLRSNPSLHVASLHATVLFVHADGSASLGGTDDRNAAEFTDFLGDVGNEPDVGYSAADLTAMTLLCLLSEVATSTGNSYDALAAAATYPSRWTAEQVAAVRESMNHHGLGHVALVAEAEALQVWSETTLATWAGADSGIAAARGAAAMAGHYPVDAVTEVIPLASTPRSSSRTPILVAAGFAALLTLGAGVTALMLRSTDTTTIPTIDSVDLAAPTTTPSTPSVQIPFPTVVPIAEPQQSVVVATPMESPSATSEAPPTTRTGETDTTDELPATRPAGDLSEPDTSTPDPTDSSPQVPGPSPKPPGDDDGTGGGDDGSSDDAGSDDGSGDGSDDGSGGTSESVTVTP
ncbi:hypothetical protein [Rhodococcoides yunnanense]|uniref:hypothetical protein n=1 Tax=Rhodococcoides yunnanense TaxID=278209 RepID=UPI0009346424|nr:hypothetical protein [Rhodococcus yunnanensis]